MSAAAINTLTCLLLHRPCRQLWDMMTQGHHLPFPQGPQRRVFIPDMSAADVCRRMLANLCKLQQIRVHRTRPADSSSDGDLSSPWLLASLVQLAPKFCLEVFVEVAPLLLGDQRRMGLGMAAVFTKLLPNTYMVGSAHAAHTCDMLAQSMHSREPSLYVLNSMDP
jgi:hypothetical protein